MPLTYKHFFRTYFIQCGTLTTHPSCPETGRQEHDLIGSIAGGLADFGYTLTPSYNFGLGPTQPYKPAWKVRDASHLLTLF